MSWICARCGSSIRDDVAVCPACAPGAATPDADVLVLRSKARTSPKRRSYNDPFFDEFWAVFPLKLDKKKAHEAWQRIGANDALANRIIAGAEKYAMYVMLHRIESRHVKYAQGWLNGERWNDELSVPPPAGQTDPAYTAGTSEYAARVQAEEEAAIAEMS